MKKIIYLLTFAMVFVNYSCSSLGTLFGGANGVCNCTCAACVNCNNKHKHVLTGTEYAQLQNQQAKLTEEEAKRKAELDSLLNMDYTIVHYDVPDPNQYIPYYWDDNELITESKDSLEALFNKSKAKTGGDTEYLHKGINNSYKENDVYFYFNTKDGKPEPLRMVVHFYADDPIEFHTLKMQLDRYKYEFKPTKVNRSTEGKFYIENFDQALDSSCRDFVAGLAQCQYGNILLLSKGVSHRIYLTEKQLKHFRDTYKLYRLMGGKL